MFDRKSHWENIYQTKELNEVSWYQPTPETSLAFVKQFALPFDAKIIDVGGGDSFLVDHLLDLGYTNITVLDIAEAAINRARKRLGEKAKKVKWVVSDITEFKPTERYDFWHDRAAFHFLTSAEEIDAYFKVLQNGIASNGILVLGTFSDKGPTKCSGIEIKQYTEDEMTSKLDALFSKVQCVTLDHETPTGKQQNFVFCSFRKS